MILDLELSGWRAYDHVRVQFKPGTTFLVARNGVGKTSLLQGAAYALFGDLTPYGKHSAIRSGFSEAVVSVTVGLSAEETLSITRRITPKKTKVDAVLDGKKLSEAELAERIGVAFGSSVSDLARLSFLPAGWLQDYDTERLHLHRHLCRLFGVDQLQAVQADLKQITTTAKSEVRKAGEVRRSSQAEAGAWAAELNRLEQQVEAAAPTGASLRSELAEVTAVVNAAHEVERYLEAREAHDALLAALWNQLTDLVGGAAESDAPTSTTESLASSIAEHEASTSARLEQVQRERGRLEGRIELLERAHLQLQHAEADCPVCRRPLDDESRASAATAHLADLDSQRDAYAAFDAELSALNARRQGLQALRRSLSSVPTLPGEPRAVDAEGLATALEREPVLTGEVEAHDEMVAGLRARVATLRTQIEDDATRQRQHAAAVVAYRREALVDATSRAVANMIDGLITEKIVPLQELVAARWKTVFRGSRPLLKLDPSGELKLVRGDAEIAFGDMSAGERAVGLLVTRLLVLSVTAPNAFMWLDEPLEQLDPPNRRLLAQLLATSATNGAVRQLVVTTFEEEIARRLEKGFDGVRLEYVTASD